MGILQLLASRNYIAVNKELIKCIGLDETILLGELASECEYWLSQEKLEDGYFYSTIDMVEQNTTLTDYQQRKAIKVLQDMGLVEVVIKGLPPKRYIKINEDTILKILENKNLKNLRIKTQKTKELNLKKLEINNNIINKKINNKENITKESFKKPSLEEVKEYCLERSNEVDAQRFIDFYESKGWYVGKNKMKDWKAAVRTWEHNNKKEELPHWFNKNIEREDITSQEKQELDDILSNF